MPFGPAEDCCTASRVPFEDRGPMAQTGDLSASSGSGTPRRLRGATWPWMLLLGLLALLIRAACFTGLIGSDDLGYSRYGHLIADGRYTPELWIYAMRYGLTVPVALAYRVFGVSEWTTIVTPYLASAASVPMLVVIGTKLFSFRAGVGAGALLATFPVSVRFATILVPAPR